MDGNKVIPRIIVMLFGMPLFFRAFNNLVGDLNPELQKAIRYPIRLAVVMSMVFTVIFLAIIIMLKGW